MPQTVKIFQAYKYGLHKDSAENPVIRDYIMSNCGCARKVYNCLTDDLYAFLEEHGYEQGDDIPLFKVPEVTAYKKREEYSYLKDADSVALANARLAFIQALNGFLSRKDHSAYTKRAIRRDSSGEEPLSFRGLRGMPRFRSRSKGDISFTTNAQYPSDTNSLKQPTVRLCGDMLHIPKCKKDIRLMMHRPLPEGSVIRSVTISKDTDGNFYASILVERELCMETGLRGHAISGETRLPEGIRVLGLDYSQKYLYVDSEGREPDQPKYFARSQAKLAKLQKRLSRMKKGSSNYNRLKARIGKLHARIRNQRMDSLQKLSTALVREYDIIAVEDIDLRAMAGSLRLGKNLHDNGFGMFREMLSYKLLQKGSMLVKVGRMFPSTQTCSCCGYRLTGEEKLTINDREWICPECGTFHDRDENAADNICEEGKRIFLDQMRAMLGIETEATGHAQARKAARKQLRNKKTATAGAPVVVS